MALEAGSVFVKLAGLFVRDEFDKWDRAVDQERVKARDPVEVKLGADQSRLDSELTWARGKVAAWGHTEADAKVGVDQSFLDRTIAAAKAKLAILESRRDISMRVDMDISGAEARLATLRTEAAALSVGSQPIPRMAQSGRIFYQDPLSGRMTGGAPAGSAAAVIRGVRGPGGGGIDNPIVTVLEASQLTALAGRGAAAGYGPESAVRGAATTASQIGGGWAGITGRRPDQAPPWWVYSLTRPSRIQDPENQMRFVSPQSERGQQLMPWWFGGAVRGGAGPGGGGPSATEAHLVGLIDRGNQLTAEEISVLRGIQSSTSRSSVMDAAEVEAIRAATSGGGGGGGGGMPPIAIGPSDGGGGGGQNRRGGFGSALVGTLFGIGARPRGGGFGGRGFGLLGGMGPFRYGLHGPLGIVGSAVGLGPEHIVSALGAVAGSAAGGLAGAGVTAAGALGQMAVGGGSDLAVMRSTIADTKTLITGYENVAKAVDLYGKNSVQAKNAQNQLNQSMAALGNTAGVKAEAGLAKATIALNHYWDITTSAARVTAVKILDQFVQLGHDFVPKVAQAAERNLTIINDHIKPLFRWLEGPQGMGVWNTLENNFAKNLPIAVDAFVNAVEGLLKVVKDASNYTGGFTQYLDRLFKKLNDMPADQLHAKIAKLHNDFEIWLHFIEAVGHDLRDLFKAGSGEGNNLIIMLTNLLNKWNAWMTSVHGQTAMHDFFYNREQELLAVLRVVGALVSMYAKLWSALQPLVPAVTAFIRVMADGLGGVLKVVVTPLANALGGLVKGFTALGHQSALFKDAVLAPLGAFLVTWRLFGRTTATNMFNLTGHLAKLKEILVGLRALAAGEGLTKLKDAFKGPGSPAAQMKAAMAEGGKIASEEMRVAMASGGRVAGAEVEAGEAAGGKIAGAEVGVGQMAMFGGFGGKAAGEQLSLLGTEVGVAGAAGAAGTAERAATQHGLLGGGLSRALPGLEMNISGLLGAGLLRRGLGRIGGSLSGRFASRAASADALEVLGLTTPGRIVGGGARGLGAIVRGGGRFLGGAAGAVPGALMIGFGGALGSQLLGQAISGHAGHTIAGIGSSAATGAGVGYLISGPLGAGAGALIGGGAHYIGNRNRLVSTLGGAATGAGIGIGGGALSGAAIGALGGPIGAGLGALVGGFAGLAGGALGGFLAGGESPAQKHLDAFQKQIQSIKNPANLSASAIRALMERATELSNEVPNATKGLNTLWHQLDQLVKPKDAWNKGFNEAWRAVHSFTIRGGESIKNMKDRFDTNLRLIAHTTGLSTQAVERLVSANFNKLADHVESAMKRGKISVQDGMNFMRSIASKGGQGMSDDLQGHMSDILGILQSSWKKGNTGTQTALQELRQVYSDANGKIRSDVQQHYDNMLNDAKAHWEYGNLSDAQYASKRVRIRHEMAKAMSSQEIHLSKSLASILDGTNVATGKGMDELFSVLNHALKSLNVSQVKWGVSKVSNVVTNTVNSLVGGISNTLGNVPQITTGHAQGVGGTGHIQGRMSGGLVPGSEFGYDDNMLLVDPMGRPRAKMAGDEGILTRYQMPVIDYALSVAKEVGAVPYGSLNDVWNGITRPHGYALGGRLRRYAGGGVVAASEFGGPGDPGTGSTGYRGDNLYQHPNSFAELNMGTALGNLPYMSPIDVSFHNKTARLFKRDIGAGGPGIGRHPRAVDIWFQAAQALGLNGLDLITVNGPQGVNVKISGGSAGMGGGAWNDLTGPYLRGPGGPLQNIAQAVLDRARRAANQYGQAHAPAMTGVGGAAGVFTGHVTGMASKPSGYYFPFPKGMSFSWQRIDQGQDMEEQPGAPVLAIAPGIVSRASDRFGGFGPYYATEQITDGPLRGRGVYYGHTKVVKTGPVKAGDVIAVTQTNANSWTAAPAGWLELGFLPYGSMSAGSAIAPILHSIYSCNYAQGGALGGVYRIPGSHKLGAEREVKGAPHSVVGFGPTMADLRRAGQFKGIPGFRRGGRRTNAGYSLFSPHKPARTTPRHKRQGAGRHPSTLSRYLSTVPGVTQFANDDAEIANLETQYSNQENLYMMYDGAGGSLPQSDLDVLVGIRLKEWGILSDEWKKLPAFMNKLSTELEGTRHQHRRKHLIAYGESRPGGHHDSLYYYTTTGGLNREVTETTKTIDKDDKEIDKLNNELFNDQHKAAVARHNISAAAMNAAQGLAQQIAGVADAIQGNLNKAHGYSDAIAALPVPQQTQSTAGAGPQTGAIQQGNAAIRKANHQITERRRQLEHQRHEALSANDPLHVQLRGLYQKKQAAAAHYRLENFDAAWAYQMERWRIGDKIRKLRDTVKSLKKKLKQETADQQATQRAYNAINSRLYGATAQDPTGTSVVEQLGGIGMDILQLNQEGADVSSDVLHSIIAIISAPAPNGLGLQIPSELAGGGGTNQTAQQALADFLAFQQSRAAIFSQFGSNFVAAGANPFQGNAGLGTGTQFYGAAAGTGAGMTPGPGPVMGPAGMATMPGGGGGGTTINITQHFASGPPDPHTYSAGLTHELGAMV